MTYVLYWLSYKHTEGYTAVAVLGTDTGNIITFEQLNIILIWLVPLWSEDKILADRIKYHLHQANIHWVMDQWHTLKFNGVGTETYRRVYRTKYTELFGVRITWFLPIKSKI